MSKLSIFDIVELAKAGYKAADIKELTSVDIPEGDQGQTAEEETPATSEQPTAENSAKETEQVKSGTEEAKENSVDYKSLYKQKCAELEKVQQTNVHQNQPKPEKQTTLDDIVRSFM